MSKTDENWGRYGLNDRKHQLAHISFISWSFGLIFGEKTHRVAGKGLWVQVQVQPKKLQGYLQQSLVKWGSGVPFRNNTYKLEPCIISFPSPSLSTSLQLLFLLSCFQILLILCTSTQIKLIISCVQTTILKTTSWCAPSTSQPTALKISPFSFQKDTLNMTNLFPSFWYSLIVEWKQKRHAYIFSLNYHKTWNKGLNSFTHWIGIVMS